MCDTFSLLYMIAFCSEFKAYNIKIHIVCVRALCALHRYGIIIEIYHGVCKYVYGYTFYIRYKVNKHFKR